MTKIPINQCAIYTRKSTEEGLDQEFNSLDAQREACLSYIASQKAEGWVALPDFYDDGGFTGGNMDRPALQKLIQDIKAGKIKTIVVYKIDRLTRSLMDFAKLVDIFDEYGVSFVSVTQSFNTTTSMGRLTLNVLLSFAQFEREVIGERVRDKIAASKKKGMWMGGTCPVGYDNVDRQLVPKTEEAAFVKMIFERYLEVGSMRKLAWTLKEEGIKSPVRETDKGHHQGGLHYSRGALYSMLRNPIYIGKIRHKGTIYNGLHPGIINQDLWDRVQASLDKHVHARGPHEKLDNLLQGLMRNENDVLYTPVHATKNGGRRYRYYVNSKVHSEPHNKTDTPQRIPAPEIEELIKNIFSEQLDRPDQIALLAGVNMIDHIEDLSKTSDLKEMVDIEKFIRHACKGIIIHKSFLQIKISCKNVSEFLNQELHLSLPIAHEELFHELTANWGISRSRKGAIRIDARSEHLSKDDPFNRPEYEIQKWVKGVVWREQHFKGKSISEIARSENIDIRYVSRLIMQSLQIG
ncbi:MAG: recombinase family protein [Micavibrio sp.]